MNAYRNALITVVLALNSPAQTSRGRLIGTAGLSIGITLVVLILYALMR